MTMREAVICEPLRTAVGRYGVVFRDVSPAELGAAVVRGLLDRTGIEGRLIDDVILGQCYPSSEAPAIGRVVALDAGLPVDVAGFQLDRRCGSGLQAVIIAAMAVQTGASDLVLAGGAESMSQAPYYTTAMRWGARAENVTLYDSMARGRATAGGASYPVPGGMIETAENLRRQYGISRKEQDELAVASHQRAVAAQASGAFAEEIVPVAVGGRRGETTMVAADEHPRPDTTPESLARLRQVMAGSDPKATVTAGNASGQNDAAAICVVTHPGLAAELGLRPLVRLRSWAVAGVAPATMGIGPVPAPARALARPGRTRRASARREGAEAVAARGRAVTREWEFTEKDFDRLNVNGSGISLGHPVGATGCRILTTLSREMRRRGARLGLETMCIGGGQGLAAVFESAE